MALRSVLVVGAGIAGSTVAYFLGRAGVAVTVVERVGSQRSSGSPVDIRGAAVPAVRRMGVLSAVREAATRVVRLAAVDRDGREIGAIPTQSGGDAVEIARRDLVVILAGAAHSQAEFRYGDTVTAIGEGRGGVEVSFERAPPREFDLVIGADGLHSTVRRLVFGPEDRFVKHLGLYIATVDLGRDSGDPRTVLIHNAPGRAVIVHPTTGREGAAFLFRDRLPAADRPHNLSSRQRLVADVYGGMGWIVPELVERLRNSQEMYFDAVSRVRMDRWSRGRTVLVGDAASCVSLFGEGSSMAVAGAAALADSLRSGAGDLSAALRWYETRHRRRVYPHQLLAPAAARLLVPASRAESPSATTRSAPPAPRWPWSERFAPVARPTARADPRWEVGSRRGDTGSRLSPSMRLVPATIRPGKEAKASMSMVDRRAGVFDGPGQVRELRGRFWPQTGQPMPAQAGVCRLARVRVAVGEPRRGAASTSGFTAIPIRPNPAVIGPITVARMK